VTPSEYQDHLANLEPGLVYPRSAAAAFNGSMRITLKGGLVVDIPVHEMQRPLRGLNSDGKPVLDPELTELQIYGREAPVFAPVLGKAFLSQVSHFLMDMSRDTCLMSMGKQVYLFVDEESGTFKLAPQAPEVTTPVPVSSASCTTALSPSDKGLIAVGSVLGASIIGLIVYALYRRFWPRTTAGTVQQEETPPSPPPDDGSQRIQLPSSESSISLHSLHEGERTLPGGGGSISIHGLPDGVSSGPVSMTSAGFPPAGSSSPRSGGTFFTRTGISD
jgi:hypothetical protein